MYPSCETTEMLDYKFTQGVYKSIPQIAFQMYVLFHVGYSQGIFSWSILFSIMSSIISITVIFIMIFDRIQCRRMAMLPLKCQPLCAIIIANAYVCCGMGVDDENVEGMVNFNSFYTSHYTWSYVFQLLSILSRSTSITWLLAGLDGYPFLIVMSYLYTSRLVLIGLLDVDSWNRPFSTNLVLAIGLFMTDSAWNNRGHNAYKTVDSGGQFSYLSVLRLSWARGWLPVMLLTTAENIAMLAYSTFVLSKVSAIPFYTGVQFFIGMLVMMLVRWFFIFHWLLPIHFHAFEATDNIADIIVSLMGKTVREKRVSGKNREKRRAYIRDDMVVSGSAQLV